MRQRTKYLPFVGSVIAIIIDMLLLYVCYVICRAVFIAENSAILSFANSESLLKAYIGGFRFDSSAIAYTNIPFLLLVLLPWHLKENKGVAKAARWVFVVVNALALMVNLCDTVYYQWVQRRTTASIFSEFGNETNLLRIFGIEAVSHWYLVILYIVMVVGLWMLYVDPVMRVGGGRIYWAPRIGRNTGWTTTYGVVRYYIVRVLILAVIGFVAVVGMRGGFGKDSRPVSMSDANQYVRTPAQCAAVLNTPFALLRTAMRGNVEIPHFYDSRSLRQTYNVLHNAATDSIADVPLDGMSRKNVVILIVESFADEFIGARNKGLDGGEYQGYTTFVDSLLEHALTFEQTFCNGWVSIDAIPAVLSSIPKMSKSFVTSPYATDDIPGLAKVLGGEGYHTAFFHGANNSSMGFQGASKSTGFVDYYGRTEYCADPRFGGDADFDGTWAIWDEEFLQFYCLTMSQMPEPFLTAVFTASSHHPFAIPDRYKDIYKDEGKHKMHKCIRYTDNAIRQFFNTARRQPWYDNTIFVITADHASSKTTHPEYETPVGKFRVPIIIYDPSGEVGTGTLPGVMQHIDIMPTILGILDYKGQYYSFGKDAIADYRQRIQSSDSDSIADGTLTNWAMNWHNLPQYINGDYILQLSDDQFSVRGLYNYVADPLMQSNLLETGMSDQERILMPEMERQLKTIMQTYDEMMRANRWQLQK